MTWTVRARTSGASRIEVALQNRIALRRTGLADDVVDPFADLGHEPLPGPIDGRSQVASDEGQSERRHHERHRVDGQRRPGPDGRGQDPGDRRADDEAHRIDGLEVGVRPPDLAPPDERRHRRRVAREEERAEDAHRRGHEQDDGHRRSAEGDRDRDERGQRRPARGRPGTSSASGRSGRRWRRRPSRRRGRGSSGGPRRCPSRNPTRSGRGRAAAAP